MKCTSCGGGTVELLPGNAGAFYRPGMARTRDTCCPLCAGGWVELSPAAGYYPAGGDAASDAAAREAAAARAAREAAERDAVLRGLGTVTGAAQTGITEGFATERARLEAEARTAQARAEAAAATERSRIEAARDVEIARARAAQPNVQLAPLETPQVAPRTDNAGQQFPVREVVIGAAILGGLYLLTRKGRR